jgi:hypothetical protein
MPKFGQMWFNGYYFGQDVPSYTPFLKSIRRIPMGFRVRKQFAHQIIFQTTRGNGYYGSELGKEYQQKKRYKVPSSINNPQGQPARDALTQAVLNWQTVLTPTQKAEYNKRANWTRQMSGYNLYIRELVKGAIYTGDAILTEAGESLTQEDGSRILL